MRAKQISPQDSLGSSLHLHSVDSRRARLTRRDGGSLGMVSLDAMTEKFMEERISTPTHGRYLLRPSRTAPRGLLVGFHGYAETAEHMMRELVRIPGSEDWLLCSMQALHFFYRGRSNDVVASWMTRTLREEAIQNNLEYVGSVVDRVRKKFDCDSTMVVTGFSQGASMAYRTAFLGREGVDGVIVLGGDIPPEIEAIAGPKRPRILIGQGSQDEWYTHDRLERDKEKLETLGLPFEAFTFSAGHEWNSVFRERCGKFLDGFSSDGS